MTAAVCLMGEGACDFFALRAGRVNAVDTAQRAAKQRIMRDRRDSAMNITSIWKRFAVKAELVQQMCELRNEI